MRRSVCGGFRGRAGTWSWVVALLTVACGDALVSGHDLDRPTYSIGGEISPRTEASLSLGILWVDPAQERASTSGSELVALTREEGRFGADFFGPPRTAKLHQLGSGPPLAAQPAFAWGELVLYEDRDGNGTFEVGSMPDGSPMQLGDRYVGGSISHVLVYVADTLVPPEVVPGFSEILYEPGYVIGRVDCGAAARVVEPADPRDVSLAIAEPSELFPELRPCLKSHPARAAD